VDVPALDLASCGVEQRAHDDAVVLQDTVAIHRDHGGSREDEITSLYAWSSRIRSSIDFIFNCSSSTNDEHHREQQHTQRC
jgi:hypothetical protein